MLTVREHTLKIAPGDRTLAAQKPSIEKDQIRPTIYGHLQSTVLTCRCNKTQHLDSRGHPENPPATRTLQTFLDTHRHHDTEFAQMTWESLTFSVPLYDKLLFELQTGTALLLGLALGAVPLLLGECCQYQS